MLGKVKEVVFSPPFALAPVKLVWSEVAPNAWTLGLDSRLIQHYEINQEFGD
jgi:hypothetical protein